MATTARPTLVETYDGEEAKLRMKAAANLLNLHGIDSTYTYEMDTGCEYFHLWVRGTRNAIVAKQLLGVEE